MTRSPVTPPPPPKAPTTAAEVADALRAVESRLKAVERDAAAARGYAGWLWLAVLVLAVISLSSCESILHAIAALPQK